MTCWCRSGRPSISRSSTSRNWRCEQMRSGIGFRAAGGIRRSTAIACRRQPARSCGSGPGFGSASPPPKPSAGRITLLRWARGASGRQFLPRGAHLLLPAAQPSRRQVVPAQAVEHLAFNAISRVDENGTAVDGIVTLAGADQTQQAGLRQIVQFHAAFGGSAPYTRRAMESTRGRQPRISSCGGLAPPVLDARPSASALRLLAKRPHGGSPRHERHVDCIHHQFSSSHVPRRKSVARRSPSSSHNKIVRPTAMPE